MPRAIMDFKHPHRMPASAAKLEDRFLRRVFRLLIVRINGRTEEIRGGQLFWVTHDHRLIAPYHRAERVLRSHLGSLVDHKQIELMPPRFEILRDGHRTHYHARSIGTDRISR